MQTDKNESLKINIDNYNGPLEVLLDLAKAQKVDLASISITQLADQFIDFISKAKEINLDLASEYLLMATWLAYLKSKLLLPYDEEDFFIESFKNTSIKQRAVDGVKCDNILQCFIMTLCHELTHAIVFCNCVRFAFFFYILCLTYI